LGSESVTINEEVVVVKGDVRRRMAVGAAQLLAQRGLEGTSFAEVLALTGTSRGSTYHHFPGGKQEMVQAALDAASEHAMAVMEPARGKSPAKVVERFVAMWRELLDRTELASGCAILAVTVAADSPELIDYTGRIFQDWTAHLAALFCDGGLDGESARTLATLVVAATEGAVALSRAQRSREPLDTVGELLVQTAKAPLVAS
jgi:TetR/AcrR family transcriptional regulator, lmrAB and yxaGH operons repressor